MNKDTPATPTPSVEELSNLARSDFDQWLKLMITGGARLPFGSSSSYGTHPLRGYFEKHTSIVNSDKFVYTELMTLHAERLGFAEPPPSDPEVMTARERIVQVMLVDINEHLVEPWRTADSIGSYMWNFIREAVSNLSLALSDTAHDVAAGAPLYRLGSSRAQDVRLEDWEQPSAFLIGKATYHDSSALPACLPAWTTGHGFNRAHIEALSLFFSGGSSELSPAQFAARRAAYRAHIGLPAAASPSITATRAQPGSKLMVALNEVQSRYYGANFSLGDQQTWPKQKDVVEWLKASRALSEREANAVDIVARPDALRGKA